jgi:hypothetical protein
MTITDQRNARAPMIPDGARAVRKNCIRTYLVQRKVGLQVEPVRDMQRRLTLRAAAGRPRKVQIIPDVVRRAVGGRRRG